MTEGECTIPRSVPHSLAMYRLVAPEMMSRMVGGRQETTRKSRYVNEILILADEGSRTMRTGVRWDIAPNAALGVEATRSDDDTHALELRLRMSW